MTLLLLSTSHGTETDRDLGGSAYVFDGLPPDAEALATAVKRRSMDTFVRISGLVIRVARSDLPVEQLGSTTAF